MNARYGFFDECQERLGDTFASKTYDLLQNAFDQWLALENFQPDFPVHPAKPTSQDSITGCKFFAEPLGKNHGFFVGVDDGFQQTILTDLASKARIQNPPESARIIQVS